MARMYFLPSHHALFISLSNPPLLVNNYPHRTPKSPHCHEPAGAGVHFLMLDFHVIFPSNPSAHLKIGMILLLKINSNPLLLKISNILLGK